MSSYTKPLPVPSKWSQPFWDGAKQHKLLLKKCTKCGTIDHPPYLYCTECWAEEHEWIETLGSGKIYAFTTVMLGAPLLFTDDIPYTIAMVDLAEGPRMLTTIVEAKPEELAIGMEVEVVFDDVTEEMSLPRFRPLRKE
ncbi:MAG: Zn-ribbon domain-containing OB-fold protein [Dehalococcoidia bacterium]|nr:Zn-ribbon domain-containing OB-fold protein [Dehalococcoidia bacterium]